MEDNRPVNQNEKVPYRKDNNDRKGKEVSV